MHLTQVQRLERTWTLWIVDLEFSPTYKILSDAILRSTALDLLRSQRGSLHQWRARHARNGTRGYGEVYNYVTLIVAALKLEKRRVVLPP